MELPKKGNYPAYFENYFKKVNGNNPVEILSKQLNEMNNLLINLNDEQANKSYAKGKWSVKEVLGHLIDTERVMSYRALAIARGEKQSLPGFEQDDYVKEADFNSRKINDLLEEYKKIRESTISLFETFDENIYDKKGTANNSPVTVRAIMFMIPGHEKHHINILKERYFK